MTKTRLEPLPAEAIAPTTLLDWVRKVREVTVGLCRSLETEDFVVQSMDDVSPTKWHLAHTSWFFETFVLEKSVPGYRPFHPQFREIFNSYYNAVGPMHSRPQRGLLSRPTVKEVFAYRKHVDDHLQEFLTGGEDSTIADAYPIVVLGLNHEQQHQELLLTDIKHVLSRNPLHPVYRELDPPRETEVASIQWKTFSEGMRPLGYDRNEFSFDNESPRHQFFQPAFRLADRLVTNGEYLEFIADGGYRRPELWLSDGWAALQEKDSRAPLYWKQSDGQWMEFTLGGLRRLGKSQPVCHLNYYEADAYAAWAGSRLPLEGEWETAAREAEVAGNLLEGERFHPVPLEKKTGSGPSQLFGDVWEWTRSAYLPYPGYKPPRGALGEYNGKFMSGQMVLRGGSCVTPESHIRASYRNFFPPPAQWQFTGLRLASDV